MNIQGVFENFVKNHCFGDLFLFVNFPLLSLFSTPLFCPRARRSLSLNLNTIVFALHITVFVCIL